MRLLALLLSLIVPVSVSAQSLMEFGDLRAGAAGTGAGAGMSAGLGHKNAVNKSFQKVTKSMTAAQKAAFDAQTKAVDQYWSSGCRYEVAKQWSNAEKTFAYVLQVITMRDGAKSASRVPVLQKLVTATKAQKKLDQAIVYQKSIVDFHKTTSRPDERAIIKTEQELSGLYLDKHDYAAAEPVLKDSIALFAKYPKLPNQQRIITLKTYGTVLRKLKRNAEAEKIEKSLLSTPAKEPLPDSVVTEPNSVLTEPNRDAQASENPALENATSKTPNAESPVVPEAQSQPIETGTTETAAPVTEKESKAEPISPAADTSTETTLNKDPLPSSVMPASPESGENKTATEK
jgi:hypothetical protein